jgi:hypothetical protein
VESKIAGTKRDDLAVSVYGSLILVKWSIVNVKLGIFNLWERLVNVSVFYTMDSS